MGVSSTENQVTKWQEPNENEINCNIDASFDIHSGLAGVGMLIRTARGDFIGGQARFFNKVPSPLFAEIMGVREALSWLKSGFANRRVVIEADN